jgi:transposase
MKVTRIAYSHQLNAGKYAALSEQATRLGRVRSQVWQRYGSVAGAGLTDRQVRDRWLAEGIHQQFEVLANAWKETVRDAMADIAANRAAAKVKVRRAIRRHTSDPAEQKRLFTLLKADKWADERYLTRQMRQHCKRGKNRTYNQIVVRADLHNVRVDDSGRLWLAVPGLVQRRMVRIPLNTTIAPTGTLRLILRAGRVEVHYQIDAATMPTSQRPCGTRTVGVDKGYTEVLTDSDGEHHGANLGALLSAESDRRKVKGLRRAKIRSVMNNAAVRGDLAKADRIRRNNLATIKRDRRDAAWKAQVRTETFTAVHAVVDKAARVVAEDLTKTFAGRQRLGKNTNRRLAAWTKGVTAEALANVSQRRGSTLVHVNAAYTSQVDHRTGRFGVRRGEKLHCFDGVVLHADVNAAINVLHRHGDPDIALHTPHPVVKQILQERADRLRTRLPVQDSSRLPAAESESSDLLSNEQ